MSTLVCFHAHPDDEALSTGGLMAKAAAAGHRVVLVTATRGEQGEPVPGVLADGEELWQRRVVELAESAELLGADPPRLLGYEDSGMMDDPANANPACFWQADVEEAAQRLAAMLTEVEADVLTVYDAHGLYGHPDHIQVHRVGLRAAELASVDHVYEATVNRTRAIESFSSMAAEIEAVGAEAPSVDDFGEFGVAEEDLAYQVDIGQHIEAKRAAIQVHRSQVSDQSFFMALPPERFAEMFSTESFAEPGRTGTGGPVDVDLLPVL